MNLNHHKRRTLALVIGAAIFLSLILGSVGSDRLTGQILSGDTYLLTQIRSDFDRNGVIDFRDFTVFAAFYEE